MPFAALYEPDVDGRRPAAPREVVVEPSLSSQAALAGPQRHDDGHPPVDGARAGSAAHVRPVRANLDFEREAAAVTAKDLEARRLEYEHLVGATPVQDRGERPVAADLLLDHKV